jgi:arsenate reductase
MDAACLIGKVGSTDFATSAMNKDTSMISIYGLKNCDTCRKALKWLQAEGIEHEFKDVLANELTNTQVQGWIDTVGWETLLNRRGTTWRKLSDAEKDRVDAAKAKALMVAQPALIKRPVFDTGSTVIVGFKDAEVEALRVAS